MQRVTSIKRKKEKNDSILEVFLKINNDEEILDHVNFNTAKFENIFSLIENKNTDHILELIKFSIEKLNHIKLFDDFFLKSVDLSLKLILDTNIEMLKIKDNLDKFYSYIRRFLMTYKPDHDTASESKHQYYVTIFKILLKFTTNEEIFVDLLDNGVYDQIIAVIRYVNDRLEINVSNHLAETFSYSIYLMFKLSLHEKYLESPSNNSLKALLLKNFDYFLRNKTISIYFEFTETIILSSLLCLFNYFSIGKDKIDNRLLYEFIQICEELIINHRKHQVVKSFNIIENETEDSIICYNLYECLVSINRFVKFIGPVYNLDTNINAFIERYNSFLETNVNCVANIEKVSKKLLKSHDKKIPTQHVDHIVNNHQPFDFEKFALIFENNEIIDILKVPGFHALIKFINNSANYNCRYFYIDTNDSCIFDKLIKILKYFFDDGKHEMLSSSSLIDELIILVFKIFIRKCILQPECKSKYSKIYEIFLQLNKNNENFLNFVKIFFKVDEKLFLIPTQDNFVGKIEIYELLNSNIILLNKKKTSDEMTADLINYYQKYLLNDKNCEECLFGMKVILEIMSDLVKKFSYNNKDFQNFLKSFKISKNELNIHFKSIINEMLIQFDKQYVFNDNVNEIIEEFNTTHELNKQNLRNILMMQNIESVFLNDNKNIQNFYQFIKILISSLNLNCLNSELLFYKSEFLDVLIKLCNQLITTGYIGTIQEILEFNKIAELLVFLLFKLLIRKQLLDYDSKRTIPISIQNFKCQDLNFISTLVNCYFSNYVDENLIKNLILLMHRPKTDNKSANSDVFELISFEIYEYFNFLFKLNLDNNLSVFLRTEFFDKKCYETVITNLVKKADAYNHEERLEDLFDLKSMLKLILNLYKRFNLPTDLNLIQFLNNLKPIDSNHVNLTILVDELLIVLHNSIMPTHKSRKDKQTVNKPMEEILSMLYEHGKNLKIISDFNNYEYTRQRYNQINEILLIFVQNATIFNQEFISRLQDLEISRCFYHFIKFYFEFKRADIIDNLDDLLEMILYLILTFVEAKDYHLVSCKYQDGIDDIDILDLLFNSILLELRFFENMKNLKIVKIFMHLLHVLAISNNSKEILKVKFKKFNLYNDLLQRFNVFKKYSCSNLIFVLLASLIDETVFNEMTHNSFGVPNNAALAQFKIFLKYYLYSVNDAFYINPEFHHNGSILYNLTDKIHGYLIVNTCFLENALKCLADLVEVNILLQKYLCYLCLEEDEFLSLKMLFRIFQYSKKNEEKLESVRIIWLLTINKEILNKVKNDVRLIDYLRECIQNHNSFNIRTYSGAILYNITSKEENEYLMRNNANKNSPKRDRMNNISDDDEYFDKTFVKLSIQESK